MECLPNKDFYGKMRLWGQFGFGLGSSAVGLLLKRSKVRLRFDDGQSVARASLL